MALPWPVDGTLQYLRHPSWWGWPLLATAVAWLVIAGIFVGVTSWQWPAAPEPGFWSRMAHIGWILWTLVKAAAVALGAWLLITPLLMGVACEKLAVAVQRHAGAPPAREEPLLRSLASTLRVVTGTLHLRLAWMLVGALSLLLGPLGFLVGAYAMAQVAVIDACDVGLAMRGFAGADRVRILRGRRAELRQAALPAALVNIGLGVTFIGWLFFLPGLVAGAARRVLDWPEAAHPGPALPRDEPPALPVEPLKIATTRADDPPPPT